MIKELLIWPFLQVRRIESSLLEWAFEWIGRIVNITLLDNGLGKGILSTTKGVAICDADSAASTTKLINHSCANIAGGSRRVGICANILLARHASARGWRDIYILIQLNLYVANSEDGIRGSN